MKRTILLLLSVATLTACAAIPAEEKALLTEEVDCNVAEQKIEAIREARPTDLDKARILASTLTLGGLAVGAATNDLGDRERLMNGTYDQQLVERIRVIATACNIPVPELNLPATSDAG